ncbi:MAG: PTS sugar transporter subunit IIC, partial [Ruminococcaceae bacterium]|nr:PTS sugar transporter subunit IIC [Oscillospiraceae bacterium]
MSKKENVLEEKIMPVADKIANNRYLLAIRDGFMLSMPLLIIGAMSLLIEELPITGYGDFMAGIFGKQWGDFFLVPYHASMAIMTIFVIVGISNSLA